MTQILFVALLGAGIFVVGLLHFRKIRASQSWPHTPGRILSARVDMVRTQGNPGEADTISYDPEVQYEYLVDNQRYVGNRIAIGGKSHGSRKKAEQALQAFQVGSSVWVFYDPAKPGQSVLEKKKSGGTMLMVIGGAIVVLAILGAIKSL